MFIMWMVIVAQAITLFVIFYLAYNYGNAQDISNSTLTNPNGNATSTAKSKMDKQPGTNSSGKLVVVSSFFPINEFVRK